MLLAFPAYFAQTTRAGVGPFLFVCGLGLVLGMRHATDADHIVALSTILSRQRSVGRAALVGSIWGIGHTLTIVAVGSLIILFGVHIPTRLGLAMEFGVAVMLVVLGLLNLTGAMQRVSDFFKPVAVLDGRTPDSGPVRAPSFKGSVRQLGLFHSLRPLLIGLVHGLAGSAAVALLVLSTIRNPYWATLYLLIFGVGTIIGMMLMTTAIAVPLTYGGKRFSRLDEYLATASGLVSLCFGLFLMYQLGYVGGLFGRHPHWIPS